MDLPKFETHPGSLLNFGTGHSPRVISARTLENGGFFFKALVKEDILFWTRSHIVAHDVSWAAQTGKHLLRTQNVSEQNQKQFLCPGHKICARNKCCARGQTGKHLCRRQCVLVCQGLYGFTWPKR